MNILILMMKTKNVATTKVRWSYFMIIRYKNNFKVLRFKVFYSSSTLSQNFTLRNFVSPLEQKNYVTTIFG